MKYYLLLFSYSLSLFFSPCRGENFFEGWSLSAGWDQLPNSGYGFHAGAKTPFYSDFLAISFESGSIVQNNMIYLAGNYSNASHWRQTLSLSYLAFQDDVASLMLNAGGEYIYADPLLYRNPHLFGAVFEIHFEYLFNQNWGFDIGSSWRTLYRVDEKSDKRNYFNGVGHSASLRLYF